MDQLAGHLMRLSLLLVTLNWPNSHQAPVTECPSKDSDCGCPSLEIGNQQNSDPYVGIAAMATKENDEFLYVDDMAFRKSALQAASNQGENVADTLVGAFWVGGLIFYDIDAGFSQDYIKTIEEVMSTIQNQVNTAHLEFKPVRRKDGRVCRRAHIFIEKAKERKCESEIGMSELNIRTMVWLHQDSCPKGVIMHELLHALGRYHEQCRPDRDNFVEIRPDEISSTACQNYYKLIQPFKQPDPGLTLAYDVYSIMHYDSCAFSCRGNPTMVHRARGKKPFIVLNRNHMTQLDISKMRLMYPKNAKVPYKEEFCQIPDEREGGKKESAPTSLCSSSCVFIMTAILLIAVVSLS